MKKVILVLMSALLVMLMMSVSLTAFAAEDAEGAPAEATEQTTDNTTTGKAYAAAICVGVVATAGAIAMGMAVSKAGESMARQPEAAGKINSAMMLGLVFIETAIIYALIVAILVIFVL